MAKKKLPDALATPSKVETPPTPVEGASALQQEAISHGEIAEEPVAVAALPVGPPTADLKEKFSAQKIPLQTDFADMIDVADCGRKAAGLSPGQPGGTGDGMQLDAQERLAVRSAPAKGLAVDAIGVSVVLAPSKGLAVDATGVSVVLAANEGLVVGTNGLGIDANQRFAPGMIMMFSGAVAPAGWAFCDGQGSRPDLRDRFVLGGSGGDVRAAGGSAISGSGASKTCSVSTSSVSAGNISVTVESTALTAAQIPAHQHKGGTRIVDYHDNRTVAAFGVTGTPSGPADDPVVMSGYNTHLCFTDTVGGGQGHKHNATATQGAHAHFLTTLPAYYILAYIIKL